MQGYRTDAWFYGAIVIDNGDKTHIEDSTRSDPNKLRMCNKNIYKKYLTIHMMINELEQWFYWFKGKVMAILKYKVMTEPAEECCSFTKLTDRYLESLNMSISPTNLIKKKIVKTEKYKNY